MDIAKVTELKRLRDAYREGFENLCRNGGPDTAVKQAGILFRLALEKHADELLDAATPAPLSPEQINIYEMTISDLRGRLARLEATPAPTCATYDRLKQLQPTIYAALSQCLGTDVRACRWCGTVTGLHEDCLLAALVAILADHQPRPSSL